MRHYSHKDIKDITKARRFEELRKVAERVIKRIRKYAPKKSPIGMVSGPISTGGKGDINKNIMAIKRAIEKLERKGVIIFNQTPFENAMGRIKNTSYYKGGEHLLEKFYLPLFEKRMIRILYFLPDWHTSLGACWENRQAQRLKMKIVYLR